MWAEIEVIVIPDRGAAPQLPISAVVVQTAAGRNVCIERSDSQLCARGGRRAVSTFGAAGKFPHSPDFAQANDPNQPPYRGTAAAPLPSRLWLRRRASAAEGTRPLRNH